MVSHFISTYIYIYIPRQARLGHLYCFQSTTSPYNKYRSCLNNTHYHLVFWGRTLTSTYPYSLISIYLIQITENNQMLFQLQDDQTFESLITFSNYNILDSTRPFWTRKNFLLIKISLFMHRNTSLKIPITIKNKSKYPWAITVYLEYWLIFSRVQLTLWSYK